jgi:hypothetical protein
MESAEAKKVSGMGRQAGADRKHVQLEDIKPQIHHSKFNFRKRNDCCAGKGDSRRDPG